MAKSARVGRLALALATVRDDIVLRSLNDGPTRSISIATHSSRYAIRLSQPAATTRTAPAIRRTYGRNH